jgi:hypothetical protein
VELSTKRLSRRSSENIQRSGSLLLARPLKFLYVKIRCVRDHDLPQSQLKFFNQCRAHC